MKTTKYLALAILIVGAFSFLTSCSKTETKTEYVTQVKGCTDNTAINYNSAANVEDSTCIYESQLDDTTRTFYSAAAHTADATKKPYIDKAHCNVGWELDYKDLGISTLTGRFNVFDASITFNEKNPGLTKIHGWVQVSTSNTSEPGRDMWGGCEAASLGVQFNTHDSIVAGPPADTIIVYDSPVASTDTAYLDVDGAQFYVATGKRGFTTSYKATGTLKFRPDANSVLKTSTVNLYFNYNGIDRTAGRTGFTGYFDFNALSDHGVTSTNISDKVHVPINIEVRF